MILINILVNIAKLHLFILSYENMYHVKDDFI